MQWLADLARNAGLPGADDLHIARGTLPADAWRIVGEACGATEDDLAQRVADHFRLKVADLTVGEPKALKLVPESVARRFLVFPLREDDRTLTVATADPTDLEVEQALGFASGRAPVFVVAAPTALMDAIDAQYSPERVVDQLLGDVSTQELEAISVVDEVAAETVSEHEVDAAPVVKLANLILHEAVEQGASDVHIEPGRSGGVVRFRVDGVLRHYMPMPMPALNRVVSRIKVLAKLDIADRLRPQDGKTRMRFADHVFDLRVSTVPTRDSEKAVIRLLDPEGSRDLGEISMTSPELTRFRRLLGYREGIILVTGPTGSGKTTTLYAALRELATGEVNILTVEDPVEYEIQGITQIQVEPRRRVTFASALRAALRQDPDVILVGEIRDLETAEVAINASLTGHLVLATLHTNDAVGVIARLRDLGLDRSAAAESLRGALAQRLVRRVCKECGEQLAPDALTPEEARLAKRHGVTPKVRAVGCKHCGGTGYRGRIPVVEVLTVGPMLKEAIEAGAGATELERVAIGEGLRPLRQVALELVETGVTTLQEIERGVGEGQEAATERTARSHVLVVDDDTVIRTMARTLLESKGFEVSEASDGEVALDLLDRGGQYDLVVLDLHMPKVDGFEVLRRVRGSVKTAALPVVVFTGSDDSESEVFVMEEGADDYIRKPIDPPRFVARINGALRRAASA